MKVIWSEEAAWALVALEAWFARRYSADRAARIVEVLIRRVALLERYPRLGRVVPAYRASQLREVVDRWHRKLTRTAPLRAADPAGSGAAAQAGRNLGRFARPQRPRWPPAHVFHARPAGRTRSAGLKEVALMGSRKITA
ncbi:MAG TPA: hypothetical protein VHT91_49195 [Kofleriaceae bacterium]|jgi:plasmid stabilization system protein ParE|nr:hypothetical protein [Kofleriaceae bacterium]